MIERWFNVYRDPVSGKQEAGLFWPTREWAQTASKNEREIDGKPTLYRIHVTLKNPA